MDQGPLALLIDQGVDFTLDKIKFIIILPAGGGRHSLNNAYKLMRQEEGCHQPL